MIEVRTFYNSRNSDGSVSDVACDCCGKIGAAYVEINDDLICQGCLDNWTILINKSILQDVMDSVQRRKEWEECLKD
jgi:uncharacterized membrane protein